MSENGSPGRFRLDGRVAFVTGSSAGLGRAIAMSLGASGAKVALNYSNNRERAERAFEAFRDAGYEGMLVQASVIDPARVEEAVYRIEQELGPVDIVVPNATSPQPQKPFEEYDWDFFQEMLDFFVKSPYLLVRATLPSMKARKWGRIINIGSEVFQRGMPNFSAYVAAKGAQTGLNRSLATELAPWNITVNLVSPGWIPVERHENDPQEAKDAYLAGLPSGRWGTPKEVGETVAFLASDEASYVSGQNIAVNGAHTVA